MAQISILFLYLNFCSSSASDFVDVRGPNGLLVYEGRGLLHIRPNKKSPPREQRVKKLGLIAGGSGITPMLQLISHVLRDAGDTTELWLLFANQVLLTLLPSHSHCSTALHLHTPYIFTITLFSYLCHHMLLTE